MSQFYLYINGVDYSNWAILESITVSESLQANGQTMDVILGKDPAGTLPAVPQGGEIIQLYRDDTLEYAGRIASVLQSQPLTVDNLQYKLTCVDFTVDLDRHLYYYQFESGSAGTMVRLLMSLVGSGFTSNNVDDGPLVGGVFLNYDTPSNLITQVAQSIQYNWYVDYNKDLNFFFIQARPAPVSTIDLDADTTTYFNAEIEEHWDQVKNVIYLTGAKVRSLNQDRITAMGDGQKKFFALGYPPWSYDTITVTVDGINQTILRDNIDGQAGDGKGAQGQAYVCLDNHGVRFPDNSPPGTDKPVEINYNYAIDPVIIMEDADSIATMATRESYGAYQSDGRHEFKFYVPDLRVDDGSVIADYGNLLLNRYANPIYTMRFDSWVQGWKPGQTFSVVSTIRNLSLTVYVLRVEKHVLSKTLPAAKFTYTLDVSTSPFPQ